jgi:hypothetical protein
VSGSGGKVSEEDGGHDDGLLDTIAGVDMDEEWLYMLIDILQSILLS